MTINQKYLSKLAGKLFDDEETRLAFTSALNNGNSNRQAVIWINQREQSATFKTEGQSAFFEFVDLLSGNERVGNNPLHESGGIYCLDNSSVFAASVMRSIDTKVNSALDVCAAPGGKSMLAWKFLSPSLLVANETISKRIPMLISNLKRCNLKNSAVACLDSDLLAKKYPDVFDLVLVDAPCSGQSLYAKGEDAPGALNPATINSNSNRQKRIVANSVACLAPGGHLVYMTCTYSIEENEKVMNWLLKTFPHMQPVSVEHLKSFQSPHCDFPAYRLYPQQGQGSGAFSVILKDTRTGEANEIDPENEKFAWKNL